MKTARRLKSLFRLNECNPVISRRRRLENGDVPGKTSEHLCPYSRSPGIRDSPHQNLFRRASPRDFHVATHTYLHTECLPGRLPPICARDRAHAKPSSVSFYARDLASARFPPPRCDARAKRVSDSHVTMVTCKCDRISCACARFSRDIALALTWVRASLELEHMVALTGCFAINNRENVTYY